MTAQKALNWAKKNKKFPTWVKAETKVKDLTPTKKGLLMRAYEKSLTKGGSASEKTSLYLLSGDGLYKPGTYNLKKVFKDQGMKALKKKTEGRRDHEVEAGDGRAYALFTPTQEKEYRKLMKENKTFFEGLTFKKETSSANLAFWKYEGILTN